MDSPSLRRTVSNEYAPTPPPPPPVFSINPTSPYTWVKPASSNAVRIPARKSDMERERERQRDYKLVVRSAMVNNLVVKTFLCGLICKFLNSHIIIDKDCFPSLQGRLEFWHQVEVNMLLHQILQKTIESRLANL